MQEKGCSTCRYGDIPSSINPCKECIKLDDDYATYWRPKEDEQEEKSINEAMTLELKMEAELSEEQKAEICGFKYPRKRILTLAVPKYEHESSKYPEQIRVSFADGHTAVYYLHVDQPAPQVIESIKIIRRMKQGYINQPPMRRRNRK